MKTFFGYVLLVVTVVVVITCGDVFLFVWLVGFFRSMRVTLSRLFPVYLCFQPR